MRNAHRSVTQIVQRTFSTLSGMFYFLVGELTRKSQIGKKNTFSLQAHRSQKER